MRLRLLASVVLVVSLSIPVKARANCDPLLVPSETAARRTLEIFEIVRDPRLSALQLIGLVDEVVGPMISEVDNEAQELARFVNRKNRGAIDEKVFLRPYRIWRDLDQFLPDSSKTHAYVWRRIEALAPPPTQIVLEGWLAINEEIRELTVSFQDSPDALMMVDWETVKTLFPDKP